ncbi:hypothetical protein Sjap_026395 [Stephania japonica]|uniref:Uncharacterized protein n=1 Tax=Stephania japonica TaxID=461633 RepID=A0AAP0E3M9_9MAGN
MGEEETEAEYIAKLKDIANQAQQLSKKYFSKNLVQKAIKSLPAKYNVKVAAIQENWGLKELRFEELMWSLTTYEMHLNLQKKSRELVLKAVEQYFPSNKSTAWEEVDVFTLSGDYVWVWPHRCRSWTELREQSPSVLV